MSDPTYNNELITRYLLGALPEAEVERLDELSVTNEEFVESLSATEKDLVDAYVQAELSGETLKQFETHYLASPLRRERVNFAQAFQVFAARKVVPAANANARDSAEFSHKRKGAGWFSVLSSFAGQRPALQWGLAAAILLLIFGGALLFQNVRLRQQMSQTQARRDELQQREQQLQKELEDQRAINSKAEQELAQVRAERERLDQELKKQSKPERTAQQQSSPPAQTSIASFILTPSLRGAGQAQSVSIPPNAGRVAMQLNLEPNDYQTYRVALTDSSNHQTLWRSRKLKASSSGNAPALRVSFSAGLFKSQAYILQVSGISASGKPEVMSDYPFKVVK